jgi:membrane protein required for colicin V production
MNWLDIVLIILLVASAIGGFVSGFIKTVFSLVGLIVGVVLAGHYYNALSNYLPFVPTENGPKIVAFIIIFLAVMIVAALLGFLFSKLISAVLLGWLDHLAGAILGLAIGSIFLAAILVIIGKYASGSAISESSITPVLLDRVPHILALLPPEFDTVRQFFQ